MTRGLFIYMSLGPSEPIWESSEKAYRGLAILDLYLAYIFDRGAWHIPPYADVAYCRLLHDI
jgi:hypothetical protein